MDPTHLRRLPRREALKWLVAAGSGLSLMTWHSLGAPAVPATGYGLDAKLLENYSAGDLWPLTLTEPQRRTATVLADLIIPADGKFPAASEVHVVDFIDEWVSAPYPVQQYHRKIVAGGLDWLDGESLRRFKKSFVSLEEGDQKAICDDICYAPKAAPQFQRAAEFFAVFRNLTAGGYYTTPAGWKEIGYVGNVALEHFEGAPPEVLQRLGLT